MKELERENRELRRANEIHNAAAAFSGRSSTADPRMTTFIDEQRAFCGVEPICQTF